MRSRALIWMLTAACMPLWACLPDDGDESGDTEGEDGDIPFEPPEADGFGTYAKGGIRLTKVSADQGVAVQLGESGSIVAPEERKTILIEERGLLVRALYEIPDDWEPREITARIVLHFPDGSSESATQTLTVSEAPQERWLDSAFYWALPPEFARPGLEYDVALYEAGQAPQGAASATDAQSFPRVPAQDSADMGIEAGHRVMDVVIVPVDHQYEGGKDPENCQLEEFSDEKLEAFRSALEAHNPVSVVTMEVRDEPLVFEESAANLGDLLDLLSMLRETDDAAPSTYYYGVINPCDWGSDAGFAGQARRPKEITKELAWKRVAVGDVKMSLNATVDTFVHEVGHNQTLQHVPCTGTEAGVVEDYPEENGETGTFGFDLNGWELKLPTHADYMSYCGPSWASYYTWNKVLPVIETLSSWDMEGPDTESPGRLLVGSIHEDGSENWWVTRGSAPGGSDLELKVRGGDGNWQLMPAQIDQDAEHGSFVIVNLPGDFDAAEVEHGAVHRVRHPATDTRTIGDPATAE